MASTLPKCPICKAPDITSYIRHGELEWVNHHHRPIPKRGNQRPQLCSLGGMPWPYALQLADLAKRYEGSSADLAAAVNAPPPRDVPASRID